jgi:pilus assembly protein Flp/PilA
MIRTAEGPKTMLKNPSFPIVASAARFMRDERGATAIEYAMIASGVAVAIAAAITSLGSNVKGLFTSVATSLK